jgi:hypothetical protein
VFDFDFAVRARPIENQEEICMKRQLVALLASALLLPALPCSAANGNIGIFADPHAATCMATVPCMGTLKLWVYALLEGSSAGGITGAEYSIDVGSSAPDPLWFFSETFNASATVVGTGALNPGDALSRGVNLAWAQCQPGGPVPFVLLETVTALSFDCAQSKLILTVVKHDVASNQFFQCPLFVLCDDPVYTKVCIGSNLTTCRNPEPPFPNNATCSTSGQFILNPVIGVDRCKVGVETATWSTMKELYRR